MKDKESFFINQFPNPHIGDDGAIVDKWVYSKDLFCEDTHFKREWMSLEAIAYKSMLVNISDAIAMNAHPHYALLGVKIPSSFSPTQLEALANGFLKAAREYSFEIIGGDTTSGDKLDISVTLISKSDTPLLRTGIQKGDLLAYTGELGSVKRDLEKLFTQQPIPKDSKFITPRLRGDFLYEAAPYIRAALDISDGLSKDLSRLSQINHIGFTFIKPLTEEILCSGEEYELLFAFDPKNLAILSTIAAKHNTPLTIFAKAIEGSIYQSVCKENHFQE